MHWIETRPGKPHIKTGIPPSLYTFRVSDFLLDCGEFILRPTPRALVLVQGLTFVSQIVSLLAADVELKIERPIKLNVSCSKVKQLVDFSERFSPCVSRITDINSTLTATSGLLISIHRGPVYDRQS